MLDSRRLVLEDVDERRADDLALLLRIGDAGQAHRGRRAPRRRARAAAASGAKAVDHLRRLVLPQQAVVDEDARQPIADRLVRRAPPRPTSRRRRSGRRSTRPSPTWSAMRDTDSSTNDAIVQSPRQPQSSEGEVAQDLEAALGVHDLGMEQQAVEPPRRATPWRRSARSSSSRRRRSRAARRRRDRRGSSRPSSLGAAGPRTAACCAPTDIVAWPNSRCADWPSAPPSASRHELHAVADAEHRDRPRRRAPGRTAARRPRDAARPARQDDAGGCRRAISAAGVPNGTISE